jgi:hypothetical protein
MFVRCPTKQRKDIFEHATKVSYGRCGRKVRISSRVVDHQRLDESPTPPRDAVRSAPSFVGTEFHVGGDRVFRTTDQAGESARLPDVAMCCPRLAFQMKQQFPGRTRHQIDDANMDTRRGNDWTRAESMIGSKNLRTARDTDDRRLRDETGHS